MTNLISYYLKASVLIAKGGRYGRQGLLTTVAMVARGECRLHWLRSSLADQGRA